MQVSERIKKAQDDVILNTAQNEIDAEVEKYHSGLANWSPPIEQLGTATEQMKSDAATSLKDSLAEKYGNRPDLMRHIESYADRELNSYNNHVDVKSADLTSKYGQASLMDSGLRTANQAALEPNFAAKELLWGNEFNKIDINQSNGIINPVQAAVMKRDIVTDTFDAEIRTAANALNTPESMKAAMDRLEAYKGNPYIKPEKLAQGQDYLTTAYDKAMIRAQNVDVSKQGDAVLASAKKDPTLTDPETGEFDHLAAAKKIDDDPNIPTKVKKYARTELEEEAGATQKLQNDKDQKMLDDLDPHVESGALTFAELTRRENLAPGQKDYLPRRVADHLLTKAAQIQRENRVENMQDRALLRQERMDKSADIRDQLLSDPGYIADQNELTPYRLKGLNAGDANIVWKVRALNSDPGWKQAVETMTKSTLYDPSTDEGRAKFSKDLIGFAKTVENKKLTGSQITDELEKELHPQEEAQKTQTIKGLLDNIWPILRGVATGQPITGLKVSPATTQTPAPPKPGNVVQGFRFKGGNPADPKSWEKQ